MGIGRREDEVEPVEGERGIWEREKTLKNKT